MLFAPGLALLIALLSYNPDDPSWSRASAHAPTNLLGLTGAYLADVLVQGLGLLAVAVPILALLWAWAALRNGRLARWRLRGAAAAFAILLASMAASCAAPDLAWPVSSGPGGLVGWLAARLATDALAPFAAPVWSLSILLGLIALPLLVWSADWPRPAPDDTPRDIDAPEPRAEAPPRAQGPRCRTDAAHQCRTLPGISAVERGAAKPARCKREAAQSGTWRHLHAAAAQSAERPRPRRAPGRRYRGAGA
ncbi:DNA translocase FtsK 4TM domain-containing protein [Hankyongella ginsenosidimutans]|uniref:DNA translocase FtsK 4TM domain-containing protein n=1 Tax=Hankyongella ginsenosidimutans TaxID=1763828 RepID=UPI001FE68915|nr:DNA translocase FtsK 4TM domain-containing protein [Hankyongella ginsenosidimutans]